MRYIKVIKQYALNSFKIIFEHKLSSVAFLSGKLLRTGLTAVFIVALLDKTKVLAGYSIHETMLFYLTYNIVDSLSQMLYREVYRFRPLILSGDFDTILVKPIHPFARILFGGIDVLDVIPTAIYVGFSVYLLGIIPGITSSGIAWYVLLILNGLLIATGFHILVLSLGIISTEVDHTIMIYRDITRFGTFPIDVYPEPFKWVITFIIPVGIMMAFPVKSALGLLSIGGFIACFSIALLFIVFSFIIWHLALAKYQSASS